MLKEKDYLPLANALAMHGYAQQETVYTWLLQSPLGLLMPAPQLIGTSMKLYSLINEPNRELLFNQMSDMNILFDVFNDAFQEFRLETKCDNEVVLVDETIHTLHIFNEHSYARLIQILRGQPLNEHNLLCALKEFAVFNKLIRWFDLIKVGHLTALKRELVRLMKRQACPTQRVE